MMGKSNWIWFVPHAQKLTKFLQTQLGDISGKSLRRALEANSCRVNGQIERFGSRAVEKGDQVELSASWKSTLSSAALSFDTIWEDASFKIVCKPPGWVCTDPNVARVFGPHHFLVHRLDKDTTGLLILAKHLSVRDQLMGLFEKRLVSKEYLALCDGIPSLSEGAKQGFLNRKKTYQGQTIWGSAPHGLWSVTHWKLLAQGKQASLLLCKPETGRTHQIRVHLTELGHPILGDRQYATRFQSPVFIRRPLLHAWKLQFQHPDSHQLLELAAPLPPDFKEGLRKVGIVEPFF